MNALNAGIGHCHDDEWLDQLLFNQALGRFICAPLNSGIRGRGVEDILAIVQIEHRVTPPPSASISGRQVNQNVAWVAQNAGFELRMRLNNAGQCVFNFHRTADLIGEKNRVRNQRKMS